jgi:DJ-1/PfpI family
MASSLNGKTIALLVAHEGAEQVELTEPWKAVEQAGGTPEFVSTEVGKIQAFNHLIPADTFEVDKAAGSVSSSDYAALVLPGGVANPGLPAHQRRRRCVHQEFLRRRQTGCGDLPRAVDPDRGRQLCVVGRSRRGRVWRPTSATPAPTGSTTRSSNAPVGQTRWCRAASPPTYPRSAKHWLGCSPRTTHSPNLARDS